MQQSMENQERAGANISDGKRGNENNSKYSWQTHMRKRSNNNFTTGRLWLEHVKGGASQTFQVNQPHLTIPTTKPRQVADIAGVQICKQDIDILLHVPIRGITVAGHSFCRARRAKVGTKLQAGGESLLPMEIRFFITLPASTKNEGAFRRPWSSRTLSQILG